MTPGSDSAPTGHDAERPALAIVARQTEAPNVQRLLEACRRAELRAVALHPAQVPHPQAPGAPRHLLLRLPSGTPEEWLSALALRELQGSRCFNRPAVLRRVHDKAVLLGELAAAGLPVPPSVLVVRGGPVELDALPGDRFVVKPVRGAAGHGVTLGLSRSAARRHAAAFADLSGAVLVQPLLGEGVDRRLLVAGGRVVAAMERRPAAAQDGRRAWIGAGRANLAYGASARSMQPGPDEIALATRAVALFGLDVAAVDLLVDDTDTDCAFRILEVNACPGLEGIEAATATDVASRIVESLLPAASRGRAESR